MRFTAALALGFLPAVAAAGSLGDVRRHEPADARIMRKEHSDRDEPLTIAEARPPRSKQPGRQQPQPLRKPRAAPQQQSQQQQPQQQQQQQQPQPEPEQRPLPERVAEQPRRTAQEPTAPPKGYHSRGEDCPGGHMMASSKLLSLKNAPVVACANQCNKMRGCKGFTYKKTTSTCFFKAVICQKTVDNGMQFFQKGAPAPAALLEEIVLEDELERVAALSPEQLRAEALALSGPPASVELLEPGAALPPHLRQRSAGLPESVAALGEGAEADAQGLQANDAEDSEDRRLFPGRAPQ